MSKKAVASLSPTLRLLQYDESLTNDAKKLADVFPECATGNSGRGKSRKADKL
jgi:hypothetical protein